VAVKLTNAALEEKDDKEIVLRGSIDLCAELGGAYLVHGSPAQRRVSDPADAQRAVEAWTVAAEAARRAGVVYCLEALAQPVRAHYGDGWTDSRNAAMTCAMYSAAWSIPRIGYCSAELARTWPADLSFEFDHERLLQVVFNLVNNAVKFTPAGGKVEVGAEREAAQVRFWVHDSGTGLGPEQLERVFERGWQAEPKGGGKGLGLYISRRIIEAHGGTMWVESTPGQGATFFAVLPVEQAAEAPRQDVAPVAR